MSLVSERIAEWAEWTGDRIDATDMLNEDNAGKFTSEQWEILRATLKYTNDLLDEYGDEYHPMVEARLSRFADFITDHYHEILPDVTAALNIRSELTSTLSLEIKKTEPSANCVYLIGCADAPETFKIGRTGNLKNRFAAISGGNPFKPYIVHVFYTQRNDLLESELHRQFAGKRTHGEWFQLSDEDVISVIEAGESLLDQMSE